MKLDTQINVACSDGLQEIGNHLAMALAYSVNDGRTYKEANNQDGDANLFYFTNFWVRSVWLAKAGTALELPEWAIDAGEIDLDKAKAAQAKLLIFRPDDDGNLIWAGPELDSPPAFSGAVKDHLTVIIGLDAKAAKAKFGLTPLTSNDEDPS